jgi:hypothetical protein
VAARDHLSRPVSPAAPEARAFCGFGALTKALHEHGLPDRWLIEVFDAATLTRLIRTNDRQGHAEVLTILQSIAASEPTVSTSAHTSSGV